MPDNIFNSLTAPVPPFRYDIQIIPVKQNGESYIYFYDQLGYTSENLVLPFSAQSVLSLLNGNRSVNDILKFTNNGITKDEILNYIQFLDSHALLESDYLKQTADRVEADYEAATVHFSNTAGISYPKDPKELKAYLDEAFSNYGQSEKADYAKALYAPHIDPRVGISSYVKAFSAIRNLQPKKIVILATSHYAGFYPHIYNEKMFYLSRKVFYMPNGVNRNAIDDDSFFNDVESISFHDRAHRIEHSIELHLLFLNYIWKHEFEIIPILVGGMDELFYMQDGYFHEQVSRFAKSLQKHFAEDDTFFLISGDLSHIGRKFGDTMPARDMFNEVKEFDKVFLKTGAESDSDKMLKLLAEKYDPYRICGFPPLYTFISAFPKLKGEILTYDLWDEAEKQSAVSFGSILFR